MSCSIYHDAAARPPFGRFNGTLAGMRPDDLAATAVARVPGKALGAARRLLRLVQVLRERNARWAMATICIGVRQAPAVVLENLVINRHASYDVTTVGAA